MLYVLTKNDSLLKLLAVNFITGTVCARLASTSRKKDLHEGYLVIYDRVTLIVQQSLVPMIYLMYHLLNRWFWYSAISVTVIQFQLCWSSLVNLFIVSFNTTRLFTVIRKASGDLFAAAALKHGKRNSETQSLKRKPKQKRKRNPWKKVPSDRFEKKKISNDKKINKQIK